MIGPLAKLMQFLFGEGGDRICSICSWCRLLLQTACLIAIPSVQQGSELDVHDSDRAPVQHDLEAFAYNGFERTVQGMGEEDLQAVTMPRLSQEEYESFRKGTGSNPPGTVYDGILWTTGPDRFVTQHVNPLQAKLPRDWRTLKEHEYRFPAQATNFQGHDAAFAWSGPGFGRIRVAPANALPDQVRAQLIPIRMIRDLTLSPRALFEIVQASRPGTIQSQQASRGVLEESEDEPSLTLRYQADDGEYELIYRAWKDVDATLPERWTLYQKYLVRETTTVWKLAIKDYPTEALRVPSRPGEIPATLHRVDNLRSLIFADSTASDWPSGWVVTAQAIRNCTQVTEGGYDDCEGEEGQVCALRQDYKCGGPSGCDWVPDGEPYCFGTSCPSATTEEGSPCPDT